MKKILKIIGIILIIIIIIGIIFFTVDYNRTKKQEKPIFCIHYPAGVCLDGGTVEYLGLGYKVIDFHTIAGFDDIKIGTWFMKYKDFEEEIEEYQKRYDEIMKEASLNNEPIIIRTNGKEYTLSNDDSAFLLNIVATMKYRDCTCDGIANYEFKIGETMYGIEIYSDEIHINPYGYNNENEAVISGENFIKLKQILDKIL